MYYICTYYILIKTFVANAFRLKDRFNINKRQKIYIYVCMYICMYVYMYVYIYIYI